MQVANTLNNNIRILFNPRIENFKLFDFLIVKSDDNRYIAQIVEIYDDKFDGSQNVAKLKLFYRITEQNEVMPYDNFTPNKECEISKIKQDEVESFINQDKETFILGTNTKTSGALNIQYDFFNNNAVVLADKVENANCITFNLAKNLSEKRNVVIIDSTGVLEYTEVKKIKASKNFKMPLNYTTIDSVFNKCLADASLEFQAIGGEIINEIKKFARKQENEFIPFNLLTRVLIQQYKATPYPELKLLLVRLKKCQMDEIFARTKAEKECLFKTIEKNPITIIDLSDIDPYWQKAYLDYIISDVEQEIYLITRVNDEHFDANLINKIYNKKKNIKFVPNVSYNYKKLPTLMQYCKNYILMPSLLQRSDFLDANFALANLIPEGCIVFGENTDNFIYLAKDYELEIQEKRKNYRKIALTLVQQEEKVQENLGEKGDYYKEEKEISDSQRLIQELSDFEASQQETLKSQNETTHQIYKVEQEEFDTKETFEEIENPKPKEIEKIENVEEKEEIKEEENKLFFNENTPDEIEKDIEVKNEALDDFQDIGVEKEEEITQDDESLDELIKQNEEVEEELVQNTEKVEEKEETISFDTVLDEESETESINLEDLKETIIENDSDIPAINDETPTAKTETKKEIIEESFEMETIDLTEDSQSDNIDLTDEELDFFQMAQESENEYEEESQENQEDSQDDIDLNDIANNSIDSNFEEIINTKNSQNANKIAIDEKTHIDADILNKPTKKENLPIFKDEEKKNETTMQFEIGNSIIHKKYGKGVIVKMHKYEDRQLLQVEFDTAGKKLLDPTVADIKLEQ